LLFNIYSASTPSFAESSAQLSSKWLKYSENLQLYEHQYEILNVKSFETFRIKTKVCDWLGHCTDVIQNLLKEDSESKTFSFKFSPFKYSEYIKLIFYVEYFNPKNNNLEDEIEFDLKLIHFGDPCYNKPDESPRCGVDGLCQTDIKNNINSRCECSQGLTGLKCEKTNYCSNVSNE
jgi:hypothetical protein